MNHTPSYNPTNVITVVWDAKRKASRNWSGSAKASKEMAAQIERQWHRHGYTDVRVSSNSTRTGLFYITSNLVNGLPPSFAKTEPVSS